MAQVILIILGNTPYDGYDATWNALCLAGQLHKDDAAVRLFLMNDAVDLARESIKPPEGYFDLVRTVKDLIATGVPVRVCGTCQGRCGVGKGEPYYCLIPTIIIGNKAVCPIIGEEYGSLERAVHYVIYDQGGST